MRQLIAAAAGAMVPLTGVLNAGASTPQPVAGWARNAPRPKIGGAMSGRSGPFWDGVEGRAPIPPAAATLGFEFIDADVEAGTIEVAFGATEAFTNPAGSSAGAGSSAATRTWPSWRRR
jgi:hypothetical protein